MNTFFHALTDAAVGSVADVVTTGSDVIVAGGEVVADAASSAASSSFFTTRNMAIGAGIVAGLGLTVWGVRRMLRSSPTEVVVDEAAGTISVNPDAAAA
jgi:hypothetical protein